MYSVYKHEAPNGKVYIGITKQEPHKRWLNGIGLAAKDLNKVNGSKIVLVCKGKRKIAYGYRWAYYENEEVMPNVS